MCVIPSHEIEAELLHLSEQLLLHRPALLPVPEATPHRQGMGHYQVVIGDVPLASQVTHDLRGGQVSVDVNHGHG